MGIKAPEFWAEEAQKKVVGRIRVERVLEVLVAKLQRSR